MDKKKHNPEPNSIRHVCFLPIKDLRSKILCINTLRLDFKYSE